MRLTVQFEIDVPDDMPRDAAEEWIAFALNARGQMKPRHPHMREELEPVRGSLTIY